MTILLIDDSAAVREVLRIAIAAVIFGLCLSGPCLADHCPEKIIIGGEPERLLAGVNVYTDSYKDVIAKLRAPTTRKETTDDPDYPSGSGYAVSEWKGDSYLLTVVTEFHGDNDPDGRVESVTGVTLTGSRSPHATGRGAALGDSLRRLKQLYGRKRYRGSINGPGSDRNTTTYCFEDETVVEFTLDDQEKVTQIFLATSGE